MELGISTGFLYDKSILESLPLIRKAGFRFVEIWASPHGEAYPHFDWRRKEQVDALGKALNDLGLRAHSLHAPFSPCLDISDMDEIVRRKAVSAVLQTLDVLRKLGGEVLVVHPASKESHINDKNFRFRQSRKSVEEILNELRGTKIRLALENQLPHIIGGDVPTLAALMQDLPPDNLGICFDTSHANLWHKPSVESMFRELADRVIALHVSDNNGRHDDHLLPTLGKIDWPAFVHSLYEAHYGGVFTLEIMGSFEEPQALCRAMDALANPISRKET